MLSLLIHLLRMRWFSVNIAGEDLIQNHWFPIKKHVKRVRWLKSLMWVKTQWVSLFNRKCLLNLLQIMAINSRWENMRIVMVEEVIWFLVGDVVGNLILTGWININGCVRLIRFSLISIRMKLNIKKNRKLFQKWNLVLEKRRRLNGKFSMSSFRMLWRQWGKWRLLWPEGERYLICLLQCLLTMTTMLNAGIVVGSMHRMLHRGIFLSVRILSISQGE